MFTTSRRPVPSTAALRILRQLAYISSGTACGAAALIAEERRRRTGVAKKIVDNSRRLKQHPRYAHSAAARKLDTSFFGPEGDWANGRIEKDMQNETDLWDPNIQAYRTRPEPDAFRSEELPSEVDKSYQKFSRRHARSQPKQDGGEDGRLGHSGDSRLQTSRTSQTSQTTVQIRKPLFRNDYQKRDTKPHGHQSSVAHHALRPKYKHVTLTSPVSALPAAMPLSSMLDLDLSLLSVDEIEATAARLSRAKDFTDYSALADRLLHLSLRLGSLACLKNIASWALRQQDPDSNCLTIIFTGAPAVFLKNDSKAVEALYTDLLLDRRLWYVKDLRLYKLLVTASILDANHTLEPDKVRLRLSQSVRSVSLSSSDLAECVLECCRKLQDLDRRSSISRLLRHCANQLHIFDSAPSVIVDELFALTLQSPDLCESAKLLRHLDENSVSFRNALRKLTLRCIDTAEETLLVTLHRRYSKKHPFPEDIFVTLCSAYANVDDKQAAVFYIKSAKRPQNESSLSATLPEWPAMIERIWSDTRNLEYTKTLFNSMQYLACRHGVDAALYNAIILACIKAGRSDDAEAFLQQMQVQRGLQPDITTFGHSILLTAKLRNWQGVRELLGMLDGGGSISEASPEDRMRLFNPVLREYASQHESTDVWSFVTTSANDYGLILDQTTFNIVMESFIRGQRLDLIQPWIAYMQESGCSVELGSYAAFRMIRRYYYDMRPSHINMMWLCRNIANSAPQLSSPGLMLLVRESIGYDIRSLGGQNAPRLFVAARARLRLLENNRSHMPTPSAWSSSGAIERKIARVQENTCDHIRRRNNVAQPTKSDIRAEIDEDVDSGYASDSLPDFPDEVYMSHDQGQTNLDGSTLDQEALSPASESSKPADFHNMKAPESTEPYTTSGVANTQVHAYKSSKSCLEQLSRHSNPRTGSSDKRQTESDILVALSLGQPSDAVSFYKRALATYGLPYSSISLETAITASLRAQWGDPAEAQELLQSAQDAEFNTSPALMPLFLQRIGSMKDSGRALDPVDLVRTVKDFYQFMEENRVPVRHHVATAAAHALYKSGKAEHAITLLRGVHESEWGQASGEPLDVVAMTVLLQCYLRTRHVAGIDWTVKTVLDSKMRIDNAFMRVLHAGRRHLRFAFKATEDNSFLDLMPTIGSWLQACENRQAEQISHAASFGNKLVRCILKCVHQQPAVDVSQREELAAQILSKQWDAASQDKDVRQADTADHQTKSSNKAVGDDTHPKTSKSEMVTAYRALLRRGLQKNGRRLKFRYVDSTPS